MTKTIVYAAALLAAVLSVLGTRFVVPTLIVCFRAIEEGFAPSEPELVPAAIPVAVTEETKPKHRKARRRRPSAKTLAAIEAIA